MPSLARTRPTFLLKPCPEGTATVFDFKAHRAAALAPTLDDGPVRFGDDDESGIALADLPHDDLPESDVLDDTDDSDGNDEPTGGAFQGHGTVPIETGRPEEEG